MRGLDDAVGVAQARRGRHFDPAVVDVFCQVAGEVLGDPSDEPDWRPSSPRPPSLSTA